MINGHGDDIYSHDTQITSNFSSNVYTKFDLSGLKDYLCKNISSVHSYPEPDAVSLRNSIAQRSNISANEICITNGATEAIYLIAQSFRNSRTAILIPTFSEYEDACKIHEHDIYFIDSLENIEDKTDLVWLCNPNNPTGKIYDESYLENVIINHPKTHFVVDQSYAAFTDQKILSIEKAITYKNVILLHSLTKCYAIPGLRLGYYTASTELTNRIKHYSMPWSVNQLALLAGKYLLENITYKYTDYLKESKRIQTQLSGIENIKVHFSDMHFFLCELERGKAADLKHFLIEKYGMLIRDASNFRGLNERYFRIAIQSAEENNQLIKAIDEWIKLSS